MVLDDNDLGQNMWRSSGYHRQDDWRRWFKALLGAFLALTGRARGDWTGAGGRNAATGSACAGKKLPITVQASTAAALDFTVWAAQVSAKCADLTIEWRQ